jgi:hypothetical protein
MTTNSSATESKNAEVQEYDLVILGSGAGGKLAAWTYGKQGKRAANTKDIGLDVAGVKLTDD